MPKGFWKHESPRQDEVKGEWRIGAILLNMLITSLTATVLKSFSQFFLILDVFLCFDPSVFILVKRWSFLSLKFLGKRFQNWKFWKKAWNRIMRFSVKPLFFLVGLFIQFFKRWAKICFRKGNLKKFVKIKELYLLFEKSSF